MPDILQPSTAGELRDVLASAGGSRRTVELFGSNTKRHMAGPVQPADVRLSSVGLRRIIQYQPRDLTISVEAGMPFAQLNAELAKHGQMIPLDGPWSEQSTVGGMIAANISGARRRLYGTARDLVIGMTFATLDGKLVQSGGMVVKNVAGLDMAKLMIGSFGTLAAIVSINFKLTPRPAVSRTVVFHFDDLKSAIQARDAVLRSQWTPVAVDLLNPVLSAQLNHKGYTLALSFAGNQAVIDRSLREASALGAMRTLTVEEERHFWTSLDHTTPHFLDKFREGAVARISTTLTDVGEALASVEGPGHAHSGNGIVRGWFTRPDAAARFLAASGKRGWKGVVEYSTDAAQTSMKLWPEPGGDFVIMRQIKKMFDPEGLLNRGRLYGQL